MHEFLSRELQESLSNEQGWEASEKEWALNVCYPESSATVNMMVSAKSRLSCSPPSSPPPSCSQRSEKGFSKLGENRCGLKEEGKKTNHASLPQAPHASPQEEGKQEAPDNSLQIIIPLGFIFQSNLHSHLCCLELGDGEILKISSSLTVT